MSKITAGDAIVRSLLDHGVDTVFGLPGAQIYGLFDAFHRAGKQLRVISARHEQGAAFMAFGYARSSDKVGVYAVVPGPGMLNTTAALCTAYGCNLPVLCLTGQVPSDFIGKGRGHLHELPDQLATLRSLAKWAARIDHSAAASMLTAEAFRQMRSGRPGPVALETPWDVFGTTSDASTAAPLPLDSVIEPDPEQVQSVARLIAGARRPMIWVGGGALGASAEVQVLAQRLGAPVVAFRSGRGIMPEDGELSVSIVEAYKLWGETDLLIGIGSRLEVAYVRWPYRPVGLKLVRIDIDAREMERLKPDQALVADAKVGVAALLEALDRCDLKSASRLDAIRGAKIEAEKEVRKIQPHIGYLKAIRDVLPRDGLFVEELCQAGYTSYYGFPVYAPRTYISCGYQGTLGFGFMTALGVKVANPDKPVVSICGDGGFLFGVAELATAVQFGIGVVTVVFDNAGYGNVRRDQRQNYDGRVIAADLRNPDFVRLAEAFGAAAYRADTPEALRPVLDRALADERPAVIHVPIDPETEVSPWPLVHPAPPEGAS